MVRTAARVADGKSRPAETPHAPANWPLLLLIFLIPLQNIYLGKFPTLGGGINFLNVFVLLSFLVAWFGSKPADRIKTPINGPLIALAICYIFSLFYSVVTLGELAPGHTTDLKDHLIPYVIFFAVLYSVRDRRGVIWTIAATILPLPYMFRVFYVQLGGVSSWHYDDEMRIVQGTFSQLGSNEVAAFYAAYSMLLMALILFVKNLKVRILLSMVLMLNMYAILYSYSRGGWLAFLGGGMFMLLVLNRKLWAVSIVAVLLLSGPMLGLMPVAVQERFDTIFVEEGEDRDKSAESRFELWAQAWQEYKKSPVFGIGYHTFHHLVESGKDTHNYFVKVLAEQGPIGIFVLALIFWRALATSGRLYRIASDPLYKALGLGMVGCVACLVLANMVGDRFSYYPLITYFWVYLALVQRCLLLSREDAAVPESADKSQHR